MSTFRGGERLREAGYTGIEIGLPEYAPSDLELTGFKIIFYDPDTDTKLYELGTDVRRGRLIQANFELLDFGCGAFSFTLDDKPPFDLIYRTRTDIHLYFDDIAWYTGFVQDIPQPGRKPPFVFSGFGFFDQLDRVLVFESYGAQDIQDIVKDIVSTIVAPNTQILYNAAKVENTGYTIDSPLDFYGETAKDAIQVLADMAQGFEFGVDNVREFYFRAIDTDPKYFLWSGKQFQDIDIEENPFGVRNRLWVKAGLIQGVGFGHIKEGSNVIDTPVEDAASIAAWGVHEAIVTAPSALSIADALQWAEGVLARTKDPVISANVKNILVDKTKTKIEAAGKVRATTNEGSEYTLNIERVGYNISSGGVLGEMELRS